jgi:predicted nucleic acid-binding protein
MSPPPVARRCVVGTGHGGVRVGCPPRLRSPVDQGRTVPSPLSVDEAMDRVDARLSAPPAVVVEPTADHGRIVRGLLHGIGVGGNLVNDAHLAALAIEHRCTIVSFDHDFDRFDGGSAPRAGRVNSSPQPVGTGGSVVPVRPRQLGVARVMFRVACAVRHSIVYRRGDSITQGPTSASAPGNSAASSRAEIYGWRQREVQWLRNCRMRATRRCASDRRTGSSNRPRRRPANR